MSIVDTSKLIEARTTFSQAFNTGFVGASANPLRTLLASEQKSTGKTQKYPMLGGLLAFKEFLGERVYQDIARYAYSLDNRKFDNSIEIDLDDFEDDQYGGFAQAFMQLGEQAAEWPEDLILEALLAGETAKSYDDVAFFSAAHKIDPKASSTTYSNLFTGTALTEANFDVVYTAMQGVKARDGRFMKFGKKVALVVPPQLETTARKIVQASQNAQGATNVLAGKAEVVPVQGLAGAPADWYVAEVGSVLRPLTFQMRKAPVLVAPKGTEEYIEQLQKLRWTGTARGAAGHCAPWLMAKAKA